MPFGSSHHTGALTTPDGAAIPYLIMGTGQTPLVMIPGFSDGRATVVESADQIAKSHQKRHKKYFMIALSRRQPLPAGFSMEAQAEDMIWALEKLGGSASIWECASAGGPIGQWVAVKRPDLVRGLILSSSFHRTSEHTRQILQDWLALARQEQWADYAKSIEFYSFSPQSGKGVSLFQSHAHFPRKAPKDPERLIHLLEGLLELDQRSLLPDIDIPAVALGGQADRVIPAEIQREMADLITNCRIKLFPGRGHGNEIETPEYQEEVDKFVHRVWSPV